ncbi:MAG: TlyA family RNA methyltransferase [Candidatus Babeliaceae bacterium]|nr:TlyA family RNA methyltransferase [Candidatus Babeliaceae bacterium]
MQRIHKIRLDKLIAERNPMLSRSKIQELIIHGAVTVNGTVITSSSYFTDITALIELDVSLLRYVSRAGLKLDHALRLFKISVANRVCLDAGLSTGGFTDCLLQHGARKVYGVDIGTAQVNQKIANDSRVIVLENTDIRSVLLHELMDIITLDLSFISIIKVLEYVAKLLKPGGILITLIKPQFEVGFEAARASAGVIKDEKLQKVAVAEVIKTISAAGLEYKNMAESPLLGGSGNKEFLASFEKKL